MINYKESYPLAGETILVTRAVSANSQFREMLEAKGGIVLEFPALVIKPPSSWQQLDHAIANIEEYDWLILTSANGVEYFFERLHHLGKDKNDLKIIKIAVVGTKTEQYLQKYNLKADFIPPDFIADSLVENFPETLQGQKILFPRVESGGREILVQELSQKGAKITEIPAYQSGCPDFIDETAWDAIRNEVISVVTFASSKTVRNFYRLVNQALINHPNLSLHSLLKNITIASIGPQTSLTCQELFQRVDIEAKEYTLEGLVNALIQQKRL
ncbi:uroporphyrinogen-III methyltransferase [Geminocystis sp. NIES-3708]|uniref:uroporphyrinogen-III synthase n=1 Tax=Geminocystis sp. NIES-3708 TaxID=1615909 RepID=UPI0005FCBC1B|nr:uroporphyrinogen-III synthase [Geminocystis sp. NIES-3708]BAQ60878.1 uroporphyrinogen-III methyltransferase [Geminocystis sp. NIES-3708]